MTTKILTSTLTTLAVLLCAAGGDAQATEIVVTSTGDGTDPAKCTLRDAVYAAHHNKKRNACPAGNDYDTIVLASGTTINISHSLTGDATPGLEGGALRIGSDVTILSRGSRATIDFTNCKEPTGLIVKEYTGIPGAPGFPTVELENVTIRNSPGRGVHVESFATLHLRNAYVSGHKNTGIVNEGSLYLFDVRVENNQTTTFGNMGAGITNTGSAYIFGSRVRYNGMNSSGLATGPANFGGGINNGGYIEISMSVIHNNFGKRGGGIYNSGSGQMVLNGSTVSGNRGEIYAAGILSPGWANVNGVTIAFNEIRCVGSSTCLGGGLNGSGAELRNTVLAKNTKRQSNGAILTSDCSGGVTSLNGNLVGSGTADGCVVNKVHPPGESDHDVIGGAVPIVPGLSSTLGTSLGGYTSYHAPISGGRVATTPGIGCEEYWDQKGSVRPSGGACEMGAVELP